MSESVTHQTNSRDWFPHQNPGRPPILGRRAGQRGWSRPREWHPAHPLSSGFAGLGLRAESVGGPAGLQSRGDRTIQPQHRENIHERDLAQPWQLLLCQKLLYCYRLLQPTPLGRPWGPISRRYRSGWVGTGGMAWMLPLPGPSLSVGRAPHETWDMRHKESCHSWPYMGICSQFMLSEECFLSTPLQQGSDQVRKPCALHPPLDIHTMPYLIKGSKKSCSNFIV